MRAGAEGPGVGLVQGAVLVVREDQASVLDVQAVAAALVAVGDEDPVAGLLDGDGDLEGAQGDEPGGAVALQFGGAGQQGEGTGQALFGGVAAGEGATVVGQREDAVAPGGLLPGGRQLLDEVGTVGGEVVDLGGVGPDVVQGPLGVVVRGARAVQGDELVAVTVVAAVAGHLAVLLGVGGVVGGVGEDGGEADAVRLLEGDAPAALRPGETGEFEEGGGDVGDVLVLGAESGGEPPVADALGPGQDEGHADAARVGVALVEAEGGVGGHAPAARVVDEAAGAADQLGVAVDVGVPVAGEAGVVDEAAEVGAGALRAALAGAAVVGGEDDDGVVEFAERVEGGGEPAEVLVDVVDQGRVHLHVAGVELLLLLGEGVPGGHVESGLGVAGGEFGAGREESGGELGGEAPLAQDVPALVVAAPVAGDVLGLGLEGAVHGVVCEVEEEGLVGVVGAQRLHHGDRLVGDVVGVVVVVGELVDVERAVVPDELVRVEEAGEALQDAVVLVEALLERPVAPVVGGVGGGVADQVPLADGVGGVAGVVEEFGEGGDVVGDLHAVAGEAGVGVGDHGVADAVRVEAGEQGGAGRRAERHGVVVGEPHAVLGEGVQDRGGDLGAEGADVAEAHVVDEDDDDVGGLGGRCGTGGPGGLGLGEGAADASGEALVGVAAGGGGVVRGAGGHAGAGPSGVSERATRKPPWPVEESGVLWERAATR